MAHPDLDALLNALLPSAQDLLSKHGEFYPMGAAMSAAGDTRLVGAAPGEEHPPSTDVINLLVTGLQEAAAKGQIRACAVCYDSRVVPPGGTSKTDAICVLVERESGDCVAVFVPYKKRMFGGLHYGELFASQASPRVFRATAG